MLKHAFTEWSLSTIAAAHARLRGPECKAIWNFALQQATARRCVVVSYACRQRAMRLHMTEQKDFDSEDLQIAEAEQIIKAQRAYIHSLRARGEGTRGAERDMAKMLARFRDMLANHSTAGKPGHQRRSLP